VVRRTHKAEEFEIHEFYVFRSASGSAPGMCDECTNVSAIMVSPEYAALLVQVRIGNIYRGIETGLIHYKLATNGALVVCLKSVVAIRDQAKAANNENIRPT
jgi:hypothetical protein